MLIYFHVRRQQQAATTYSTYNSIIQFDTKEWNAQFIRFRGILQNKKKKKT